MNLQGWFYMCDHICKHWLFEVYGRRVKMKTARFFQTLVPISKTIHCHITQYHNLDNHVVKRLVYMVLIICKFLFDHQLWMDLVADILTVDSLPQTMNFLTPELLSRNIYQPYDGSIQCVELGQETFPCFQCGNKYRHRQNLMRHIKYECGKEPQFCCPFCTNRYRQKSKLLGHIDRKHSINYQCSCSGSVYTHRTVGSLML